MDSVTAVLPPIAGDRFVKEFPQLTAEMISSFATQIGDHNPVHHSDEAALACKLLGRIATTVQIFGFISATIAERYPQTLVREVCLRPKKPLYADSFPAIECEVTTAHGRLFEISVRVKNGCETVTTGTLRIVV